MSPLNIEAEKPFGVKATVEGVDEALESSPVVIIRGDGEKVIVDPEDHSRFLPVREEEMIVIPDVEEGEITVTTPFGLKVSKNSFHSSSPRTDLVALTIELEGTGYGEKPVTRIVQAKQAWAFENPVPVMINREKIAEVSWSEE